MLIPLAIAPIKVKFANFTFHFDRVSGALWVYGPKNFKKCNFTNILSDKGQVPCMILTKSAWFVCVLRLHNSAKFGLYLDK